MARTRNISKLEISVYPIEKISSDLCFIFGGFLNNRFRHRISMRHLTRHVIILSRVILFVVVVGTEPTYGALEDLPERIFKSLSKI